jgi:hypothetical protein
LIVDSMAIGGLVIHPCCFAGSHKDTCQFVGFLPDRRCRRCWRNPGFS